MNKPTTEDMVVVAHVAYTIEDLRKHVSHSIENTSSEGVNSEMSHIDYVLNDVEEAIQRIYNFSAKG